MRPTIDEQLAGMRRTIQHVLEAEAAALSPRSRDALTEVMTVLRRIEGSWRRQLAFLAADNAATEALLADLGAPPPAAEPAEPADPFDFAAADARNEALRAALVQAVRAAAGDPAAEARLARHFRERLDRDPTAPRRSGD
ncbi:MAG: hypothetical protein ACKVWR_05765 [Acidimicrobiales bacterium]